MSTVCTCVCGRASDRLRRSCVVQLVATTSGTVVMVAVQWLLFEGTFIA